MAELSLQPDACVAQLAREHGVTCLATFRTGR
ncbi:hypothetical protein [Pantoea ananatis]